MTCQVITRFVQFNYVSDYSLTPSLHSWYRPPELLFGARYYSSAVDIWSVGCIFAELMLRTPYLAGETDMDQIKTTFRALGTPTELDWPVRLFLSLFMQLLKKSGSFKIARLCSRWSIPQDAPS